jgi:hypothetical protein
MTVRQMKAILAKCKEGKTLLIVTEKREWGNSRRLRYFAVFTDFVQKQDEQYTDGPTPPNWLYVETGKKRSHLVLLRDVFSIELVPKAKVRSLLSGNGLILDPRIKLSIKKHDQRESLELVAGFLNGLIRVRPSENTL